MTPVYCSKTGPYLWVKAFFLISFEKYNKEASVKIEPSPK